MWQERGFHSPDHSHIIVHSSKALQGNTALFLSLSGDMNHFLLPRNFHIPPTLSREWVEERGWAGQGDWGEGAAPGDPQPHPKCWPISHLSNFHIPDLSSALV